MSIPHRGQESSEASIAQGILWALFHSQRGALVGHLWSALVSNRGDVMSCFRVLAECGTVVTLLQLTSWKLMLLFGLALIDTQSPFVR